MPPVTLEQIQEMIDQLAPADQMKLLHYLAPRIARSVELSALQGVGAAGGGADAWAELFKIGDRVAALDRPDSETLTATLLKARL